MAKEKTTTTPKVSDAVIKIGQELLKSYPDMKVIHMTADGRGFFRIEDAAAHAATLKNKTVTPIERAE